MAEEIGLFEAIHTFVVIRDPETKRWIQERYRALRYIRPDAIPDSLVRRVLEAGTRAPSGGNQQRWHETTRPPATWWSICTRCQC
jgi:hypothetical protein